MNRCDSKYRQNENDLDFSDYSDMKKCYGFEGIKLKQLT